MREPGRGAVVGRSVARSLIVCPREVWRYSAAFLAAGVKPVVAFRGFRRHDALCHVLFHQRGRARARIAEAGAAGQPHFDDPVGARQCDQFAGAAIVHHVAVGIEHHAAHAAARQAAVQPFAP